MNIKGIGDNRKLQIIGLSAALFVTILSYIAHTPVKLIIALIGISACVYSGQKLQNQFNVPIMFIRRDGLNYWGGAFGGLIGGISSLYGSKRAFGQTSFSEFGVELSLIIIYMTLALILFTGTILQDIKDGYLEV